MTWAPFLGRTFRTLQNLELYSYRAVLFTYSLQEESSPSYKKFQAFLDKNELKMALRARKLSGAFEKRAPGDKLQRVTQQVTQHATC